MVDPVHKDRGARTRWRGRDGGTGMGMMALAWGWWHGDMLVGMGARGQARRDVMLGWGHGNSDLGGRGLELWWPAREACR